MRDVNLAKLPWVAETAENPGDRILLYALLQD